ncbi:hypothetical protein GQ55_6G163200 [Panicum hallii var. hallii]|uniref:Uncharacterized protein n=1 Tax=Panicum hallii var. hallii TaxID=1504633 RepID=A0A2T7D6K5_9POAL|nr:hypothetical protein GQ55_6G163200 [Panicum hallii var. hallii]
MNALKLLRFPPNQTLRSHAAPAPALRRLQPAPLAPVHRRLPTPFLPRLCTAGSSCCSDLAGPNRLPAGCAPRAAVRNPAGAAGPQTRPVVAPARGPSLPLPIMHSKFPWLCSYGRSRMKTR